VNRVDRGPLLLTLAAILLLLAVVAYLISDVEENLQRKEAVLRGREALRFQMEQAIEDRKTYRDECGRMNKERAELHSQHDAILKALTRIEESLGAAGLSSPGL
jgi:predicted  nucleic acid-binding Zn-ribbon protein